MASCQKYFYQKLSKSDNLLQVTVKNVGDTFFEIQCRLITQQSNAAWLTTISYNSDDNAADNIDNVTIRLQ